MAKFIKFIFHISVLFLIIISLYPGSLFGYLLYDDFGRQPNLIKNPFGTAINHFICYAYISLLGLFIYLRMENFQRVFYGLYEEFDLEIRVYLTNAIKRKNLLSIRRICLSVPFLGDGQSWE